MLIIESIKFTLFIYVNRVKKLSRVARIDKYDRFFSILFNVIKANNYDNIIRYDNNNKNNNDRRIVNVSVRIIINLISAARAR